MGQCPAESVGTERGSNEGWGHLRDFMEEAGLGVSGALEGKHRSRMSC